MRNNRTRAPRDRATARRDASALATRIVVAAVFLINVQCALSFALQPASFAGAYELSGVSGNVAVQGIGVAFLM